jgi:AraC family transcriptional regulator
VDPRDSSFKISETCPLFPGSSLCRLSSVALGWSVVSLARHRVAATEHPGTDLDRHFIILWDVSSYRGERAEQRGHRFGPYLKHPGMLSLVPTGIHPAHVGFTETEAVVCSLDPAFLTGIEEELDLRPVESVHEQLAFHDAGLRQLISLLEAEAKAGGPCGKLYADSLVHALATRFLYVGRAMKQPSAAAYRGGLSPARLRRVVELVEAKIEDELSLEEMAKTAQLSRAHFSHMFRQSTGESPHQFFLRCRVERAKQMLRAETRVLDVAVACGFKTQQHFARVFRHFCGVSPTEYRQEFLR